MNRYDIVRFRATHNLSNLELMKLANGRWSHSAIRAYGNGIDPLPKDFRKRMRELIEEYGTDETLPKMESYNKRGWKRPDIVGQLNPKAVTTKQLEERPASSHYHLGSIDVWKFSEENYTIEELIAYHGITATAYITRFGKKDGYNIKDIEKAEASLKEMKRLANKKLEASV